MAQDCGGPLLDCHTASEIRSLGVMGHQARMTAMGNSSDFFSSVLKAQTIKTFSETDLVEGQTAKQLLNSGGGA